MERAGLNLITKKNEDIWRAIAGTFHSVGLLRWFELVAYFSDGVDEDRIVGVRLDFVS